MGVNPKIMPTPKWMVSFKNNSKNQTKPYESKTWKKMIWFGGGFKFSHYLFSVFPLFFGWKNTTHFSKPTNFLHHPPRSRDTFMEQIKGLNTRKLRHRGLLRIQPRRSGDHGVPHPSQKKTEHETKRCHLIFDLGDYVGNCWEMNTMFNHLMQIRLCFFFSIVKYCWNICNFPLSPSMPTPPKKIAQSMTIRSFSCSVLSRALLSCRRCCTCESHHETKTLYFIVLVAWWQDPYNDFYLYV